MVIGAELEENQVLKAKVAALEARCARLEREALRLEYNKVYDALGLEQFRADNAESERDALQVKLVAARSAFDSIICLAVEGPDGFGSALKACQAIQKKASASLADATPDEVQP